MALTTLAVAEAKDAKNGVTEVTLTVTVNGPAASTYDVYVDTSVTVTIGADTVTFYGAQVSKLVDGTIAVPFVFNIGKVPLVEGDLTIASNANYVTVA